MTIIISSSFTAIYKFIVPLIPILLALVLNSVIEENSRGMIVFFLIITVIQYIQLGKIKKVSYDEKYLFVSNFIKKYRYNLEDITSVYRTFFDSYIISIKTDDEIVKVKFSPSFSDRILKIGGNRKTINEFKEKIRMAVANSG
ncbi:hypothetical protein [Plebeiibacterium marinum]|uniref:Uncharacterized protein n=1 Tax=Plebeiibacterium marinum TaxID=2992111 RepID=A0AAE3MDD6_9BACT|nr:hypothetical protein [Plebeiobacterium marinum]MCW3805878.1 hypothetical protein [Plebeiobacterium marinum]